MQFDTQSFGPEQPPRTFGKASVSGRSLSIMSMLPSGIVLALLLYELHREANLLTLMLLLYVGWNCYSMLAVVFRRPRMAIRDGRFSLRFGRSEFSCPAADVADLRWGAEAVHLTLSDTSRVEPETARQQMATRVSTTGCQIGLPATIFSLAQVNRLRAALGMPEQTANAPGERPGEFQSGVKPPWPLVTASLIAACVIVCLAEACRDRSLSLWGGNVASLIAWGANYGPRTLAGQWWRLVTHLFLHIGLVHLLMNMWALWIVGPLLERLTGHTAMAMIYLLAGIAGGMASLAFHPTVVSAGASGAIFGIIGALFGLLLHARDAVPAAQLQQLRNWIITIVILNVFIGLSVPEIDNAAHAGGAIAGLLAGLIVLPAKAPGQWLRIGILAVVGTGAVLLAATFLPPPPIRQIADAVPRQLLERHRQIGLTWSNLIDENTHGKLSNVEFANKLEANVIDPWRELAKEISAATKARLNEKQQQALELYLRLQQESFEDWLAFVRDGDNERFQQSSEKQEAAANLEMQLGMDETDAHTP